MAGIFDEQQGALSYLTPPAQFNWWEDPFSDPFRTLNPTNELPLMVAPHANPSQQLSGMGFGPGPTGLTAAMLDQPMDNPQSLVSGVRPTTGMDQPQYIPSIPGQAGGPVSGKVGVTPPAPMTGWNATTQQAAPGVSPGMAVGQPPIESPFAPRAPSAIAGGLMDFIRRHEGFRATPYSDFQQTSIGFGTRARPGETQITREEAERRLQEEVGNAHTMVRSFAPNLTPGQLEALTDLTFNAGPGWMQSGLGQAVRTGDWARARELFLAYVNAGGQPHAGLRARRAELADQLIGGNGLGGQTQAGFTATGYEPGADVAGLGMNPMLAQPGPGALNAMVGQPVPGMAQAPQAPTVPPISPTARALVPGLGRAPTGPQPGVARMGIQGIGDVLGWSGASQGVPMTSPADFFGHLPVRQQQAATEVFVRGQELRMQNPTATADQLMQMLIRDPVWGRNAISIGPNPVSVIQAAVNPPPPAPGSFTLNPGDTRYGPDGRPIAQAPPRVPDQATLVQWLQSLPPEQRQEAMTVLAGLRARVPSDRAQAQARVEAIEAAGGVAPINDLLALGRIRPITRVNQFGNPEVIGYQDVATGRPYGSHSPTIAGTGQVPPTGQPVGAAPTPPSGPPPLAGGVGANVPPIPSLQGVTAPDGTPTGFTIGQQPWQPGQPIPPELRRLYEQGAFAPGAMSMNLFQPTVGGQPITPRPDGATPPASRPSEMPAPGPIDTTLRRFRFGSREYNDAPGLSYSTSQLNDPAEMFLSVGVGPLARQFMARIAGQVPGLAQTEEAATARAAALDNLRAVFATYQQGSRQLRGEFETTMAGIPTAGEILSSPTRAFQQAITLRERVLADYQLALGQAQNMSLPQSARTAAAERATRAQAVLQAMPSMEQLFNLQDVVRRGQATGTGLPGLGEITGTANATIKGVTGSETTTGPGTARIPPDLTDTTRLPSARLVGLAKQPGVTDADLRRIRAELERRIAIEKGTRAPLPPRSE